MLIDIRADDPTSWGRDRGLGQWMHSGYGRQNPHDPENLLTPAGLDAGAWIDETTIVAAHPLPSGSDEVVRFGHHQGVPVIDVALMFDSAADYQWKPGALNPTVGPPKSHHSLWDGVRSHLDLGPVGRIGPGSKPWTVVLVFVAPDRAEEQGTLGWSLHEPGTHKSGPLACSIRQGALYAGGKLSMTPVANDDKNLPRSWSEKLMDLTPGEMVALVWNFRVDPGGSGFLTADRVRATGGVERIVERDADFGWTYADPALNDGFRVQALKSYHYLRWSIDGDWKETGVVNWDTGAGPIRHQRFARFVVASDGELTYDQAVARAREVLPMDRPPPSADLAGEVAALRGRLDAVEAEVARQGERWDRLARAAQEPGS